MDLLIIFLTIICGAVCIYFFGTRNLGYFKKLGIPHLKPVPIFGNVAQVFFMTKSMTDVFQEVYDIHPDAKYLGIYDCLSPIILLKDPELVKSIGIKNFDSFPNHRIFTEIPTEPLFDKSLIALKDDAWRDMRTLLSPAFTSSKMKMMFETLSKCSIDFANHLAEQRPQPEELDMKETFGRYTLDVIASAAFGLSVNSMEDPNNEFYRLGKSVGQFSALQLVKFLMVRGCPWLAKVIDMSFLDRKASSYFTNAIETTIAAREAQGIVRPDMIQLMMQANERKDRSALTSEDMTAQAFIFFLGGFDSPATTMSFAAYALALNPEIQRKLQAEIDQVMETSSGEVSYEDLHAMKYLDAVISETLRLFPPAPALDRVASKGFTLPPALPGLKPLEIKPGQTINIPAYCFHRDPRYFSDPEKFDPERFSEENKSKINPLTYFPFGIGPRICIANRFALMEVKLALFHLLSKCSFLPTPKTQSPIKLSKKTFAMMPEGGFWLKIEPRQ